MINNINCNQQWTEFTPLPSSMMESMKRLVIEHGFNFSFIGEAVGLPQDLVTSVMIRYYSHLLAQYMYIPASILPDFDQILPATLQTQLLRHHEKPINDIDTWFTRSSAMNCRKSKELKEKFIMTMHTKGYVTIDEAYELLEYSDARRSDKFCQNGWRNNYF